MIKDKIKSWLNKLREMLFPEYSCFICNLELEKPELCICDDCNKGLVRADGNICLVCGEPIPEPDRYCEICSSETRPFDISRSCFVYNEYSSKLVMGLKYNSKKFFVKYMATELLRKMEDFGVVPDIIAPVPVASAREKTRKFNQCELLAYEMKRISGLDFEVMPELIIRVKDRPPQAGLNRAERLVNLEGAFAVNSTTDIKDKIILILDDVYTTGSTISEISRTLRKKKPKGILALTFAKTQFNPPLP